MYTGGFVAVLLKKENCYIFLNTKKFSLILAVVTSMI